MAPSKRKKTTKTVTKARVSNPPLPAKAESASGQRPSLGKWLIIAVLLAVAWEVGNSFLGNSSSNKTFVLKRVAQFTATEATGSPMAAFGMAVVGPNELAVADAKGCRILLFDFHGKLLKSWGKRGSKGPYEFNEPSDVALDSQKHLYVLDNWNGLVKLFDLQGKFLKLIDLHKQPGSFFGPRRMAWAGDTLIIPSADSAVRLSIADEKVMDLLGGKGTGKGEFQGVSGVALDQDGNIYLGDQGNKRVQEFDKSGKFLRVIKTKVSPEAIALDSKGHLFVGSDSGPVIFDTNGKFLGRLTEQSQPEASIPLASLCVAPDGRLIVGADDEISIYQVPDQGQN